MVQSNAKTVIVPKSISAVRDKVSCFAVVFLYFCGTE